ncbi:MAG: hypothetical protein IJM54_10105 [Thermoguttaceae bacterium]|nr:hypothetical protein [Thermoguttaceae bacterium]
MLEQLNRRIPELEAIVLLKTKLSLFELGNEISAKFFDNKICLGNYEEWLFDGECESIYVDFAGLRYILVEHIDKGNTPIKGEFIFAVEFMSPVDGWTVDSWHGYVNVSAFYGAQLAKLNLKDTTVAYKNEDGVFITL